MEACSGIMVESGVKLGGRSGRTPLQVKKCAANNPIIIVGPTSSPPSWKKKQKGMEVNNKENVEGMWGMEWSLGEELSAVKKTNERMRGDRERTERMLEERESVLDAYLKEMQLRWQLQKCLEMEVDRLFRLKELNSRCMHMTLSPIKSLREKELGKARTESSGEEESELQSPASASASASASPSSSSHQ